MHSRVNSKFFEDGTKIRRNLVVTFRSDKRKDLTVDNVIIHIEHIVKNRSLIFRDECEVILKLLKGKLIDLWKELEHSRGKNIKADELKRTLEKFEDVLKSRQHLNEKLIIDKAFQIAEFTIELFFKHTSYHLQEIRDSMNKMMG